jgi:hypothetical protein
MVGSDPSGTKGGNGNSLSENAKRFLDLYDNKSKDFRRYFAILVGVSLFLLIFMLFPFVNTQYMQYNVSIPLRNIAQSIEQVESNLTIYQEANSGIVNLTDNISNGPNDLRNFILELEGSGFSEERAQPSVVQAQTMAPIGELEYTECSLNLNNMTSGVEGNWTECNVHMKVREQFQGYNQTLFDRVVIPLQKLNKESQQAIGIDELVNDSKRLQEEINQTLVENPRFWETVQGKELFFEVTLIGTVENFWDKYDEQIKNQRFTLEDKLSVLEEDRTRLENDFSRLNNELGNITKRLEEFESPIGKLTIGFDDLVMFFPLGLASGFLVVTSMLIDAMKLRRDYLNFHPRRDKIKGSLSTLEVARTAPLWVDHEDPGQNKIGRFAILFLPVLIYLAACAMIFFSWWEIPESSLGDVPAYRPIFAVAYLISGLLVFPYCYLKIIREYQQK